MLQGGFYAVEWEPRKWFDLVQKLKGEGKLGNQPERLGLISLLRKIARKEPLPKEILLLYLDRAIYDAFWLNGGEAKPDEALKSVRRIVEVFGRTLAENRQWLQSQYHIILAPLSLLEHRADGWWAGIRFASGRTLSLFQIGWLVPNPALLGQVEVALGVWGCFSPF